MYDAVFFVKESSTSLSICRDVEFDGKLYVRGTSTRGWEHFCSLLY
jgi:hypothetical protein